MKNRKETEEAIAAEKAKEAEFNDMRASLDEAKASQDAAQSELNRLNTQADECTVRPAVAATSSEPARPAVTQEDCDGFRQEANDA